MRLPLLCALGLVSGAGAACAQQADVLHYWTSGSEAAALSQIAKAFTAKGGTWVDDAVGGFEAERTIAVTRFAGGNPPAAMLTELGQETRNLVEAGVLRDLSPLYASNGWSEELAPAVLDALTIDGKYYAVPVDVGGRNWMYANSAVFETVGVKMPATWDEFFAVADKIKAAGYVPLAVGGESWQEALLFSALMDGVGGNDFFARVYDKADADAARSDTMVKVFETFRRLQDYVDDGVPGRAWNEATNMVVTGKAAMIIMGDWAKGEFLSAGQTPGKEFQCVLAPGTQHFYDAIVDAFVFPKVGKDALAGQDLLIRTMMDPAVQVDFNRFKGSLPPLSKADTAGMDACAQLGARTMASPDTYLPGIVNRPTNDVAGQLEDVVSEFWNTPDMSARDAADRYADIIASAS